MQRAFRGRARVLLLVVAALVAPIAPAHAISSGIVISQVYGGGGNSGATLKNDFIELVNRGNATISVAGWSVQVASATGTSWQVTALSGSIAPGAYYLVHEAAGGGGTVNLPAADATGTINLSATAAKVALVNNATALSGSCPTAGIVDFVGYGSANCFEGSAAAPTLSNTTAALRGLSGCADTDGNAADFAAGAPNPRNSAATINVCAVATDTPTNTATATPTSTATATASMTPTATSTETPISTASETASHTPTSTPTATDTATATDTPTETPTDTPSETPTSTPSATATETATHTATATPSDTPSATTTETASHTPTSTPTATDTATATDTPTETPTNTPSETSTSTPSATATETATHTATATATDTPTASPTASPSMTATVTTSHTPTRTPTATPSATPTRTRTNTTTATPTRTATSSPTPTASPTPSPGHCGNGRLEIGEQCDDGNALGGDGCRPDCTYELIPGDSVGTKLKDRSACQLEWMVINPNNAPHTDERGRPFYVQSCTDNDPTCDFDPDARVCEFHVAACLNNRDPLLPTCPQHGVGAVYVRAPQSGHDPDNFNRLSTALTQFRNPATGSTHLTLPLTPPMVGACTMPFAIRVPLLGGARPRTGRVQLGTLTRPYLNSPPTAFDLDDLFLICNP